MAISVDSQIPVYRQAELLGLSRGSLYYQVRPERAENLELMDRIDKQSISMDGKGRASDNIMVERLWRSLKYEEVYPKGYCEKSMTQAKKGLKEYFDFYNEERQHQSLGYKTPRQVYENNQKLEATSALSVT